MLSYQKKCGPSFYKMPRTVHCAESLRIGSLCILLVCEEESFAVKIFISYFSQERQHNMNTCISKVCQGSNFYHFLMQLHFLLPPFTRKARNGARDKFTESCLYCQFKNLVQFNLTALSGPTWTFPLVALVRSFQVMFSGVLCLPS